MGQKGENETGCSYIKNLVVSVLETLPSQNKNHVNYLLMLRLGLGNASFMDKLINHICLAASTMTLKLGL